MGWKSGRANGPAALSGGQKQRVALARALIHRPGLLLLDEPLGALDALTRLEMQDLIVSLWQEAGFTVLLVTHDVSEAVAMADRVLLIEDGKIGLDLTVDIARPRRLGSVRLAELEANVLSRVMQRGVTEQPIRRQDKYSGRCRPGKHERHRGILPDSGVTALSGLQNDRSTSQANALVTFSYRSPERFSSPFNCSSAARIFC